MMFKKYIFLLILIFTIKLAYGQIDPAIITLTPSSQIVNNNDPVSVDVGVEGVVGLFAISVTLSFDNSIIKCLSITQGDFLSTNAGGYDVFFETFPEDLYSASTVIVEQSILGFATVSGSGEIFTIIFEPFAEGTSQIEVTSFSLRDINNQEIPAIAESAEITVTSSAIITLTPLSQIVNSNDPVSVDVGVEGVVGLFAISVTLSFDNSIIKCLSITQGDFLSTNAGGYDVFFETFPEDLYSASTVIIEQSILGLATVSGSGEIFTITFEPFAVGTSQIEVTSFSLRDINNQEIPAFAETAEIIVDASVVNAKVFLQGPYNSGTGNMNRMLNDFGHLPLNQPYSVTPWNYNGTESVQAGFFSIHSDIVDWVLIELRSDESTPVATQAALLKSDGSIVDINGSSAVRFFGLPASGYYIVVRHRNHLAIMSSNLISLSGTTALYNFTTAQTQAYGLNAMTEVNVGVFGTFAADANADGSLNATDLNVYWIPQNGTPYDYLTKTADFNLDGSINATDLNEFWIPNNGRATQVP